MVDSEGYVHSLCQSSDFQSMQVHVSGSGCRYYYYLHTTSLREIQTWKWCAFPYFYCGWKQQFLVWTKLKQLMSGSSGVSCISMISNVRFSERWFLGCHAVYAVEFHFRFGGLNCLHLQTEKVVHANIQQGTSRGEIRCSYYVLPKVGELLPDYTGITSQKFVIYIICCFSED
jgi:hypothetical protein